MLKILRESYADFGPTPSAEKLADRHHIRLQIKTAPHHRAVLPRRQQRAPAASAPNDKAVAAALPAAATDTGINRSGCSSPARWPRLPEAAQTQPRF